MRLSALVDDRWWGLAHGKLGHEGAPEPTEVNIVAPYAGYPVDLGWLQPTANWVQSLSGSPAGHDQPFLLVTPRRFNLTSPATMSLDAAEFTARVEACQQHPHRHLETCVSCSQRLRQGC